MNKHWQVYGEAQRAQFAHAIQMEREFWALTEQEIVCWRMYGWVVEFVLGEFVMFQPSESPLFNEKLFREQLLAPPELKEKWLNGSWGADGKA